MKHFCSFSEAIREGAKLRPQCFGELERNGATCAIGAGMEAIGLDFDGWPEVERLYPYLSDYKTSTACPACQRSYARYKVITHLNDGHHWTREQIADWLESEEEKLGFVTIAEPESLRSASPQMEEVTV